MVHRFFPTPQLFIYELYYWEIKILWGEKMLFNKQQKILILNKYIRHETLQLKKFKKLESINSSEINSAVIRSIFYYIK